MGDANERHRADGLDDRTPVRDRLREARAQQAAFEPDHRPFCAAEAQRATIEPVLEPKGEAVMNQEMPAPVARLTMITLGVSNMRARIAFYEALGFTRKFRATGETVAFFETGGTAIGLFPWDQLAQDVTLSEHPRPPAFRGVTLAWNCRTM